MTYPAHKINKIRNFGSIKMLLRNLMFSFAKSQRSFHKTALVVTISITFMLFFTNSTDFPQKEAEILKVFWGVLWLFPVGALHNCVFAISVSVHC